MIIKNVEEKLEKTFIVNFINSKGEEDDYEVTAEFDKNRDKWVVSLRDDFDDHEIEVLLKLMKELNKTKFVPIKLEISK